MTYWCFDFRTISLSLWSYKPWEDSKVVRMQFPGWRS